MRLRGFINELASNYGKGITFIDIDETIFQTKALIYVMDGTKVVKKLTNQEFNGYQLDDGQHFDFREFADAELFSHSSTPIPAVVNRIKRMFKNIDARGSKVVLLTARADFDNKEIFLQTFRNVGIPIDDIYVERTGNMKTGTTSQRKEKTVLKYIKDGDYRRVRLIDDDMNNIKGFLKTVNNLPQSIIDKVKKKHGITGEESIKPIEAYALHIDHSGKLRRIQ